MGRDLSEHDSLPMGFLFFRGVGWWEGHLETANRSRLYALVAEGHIKESSSLKIDAPK